ncbi:MAG: AMP-binding protein, partial [Synergistaceae bacterium]|nr:AMP-binding protein [Synergistaceae bacterium]
MLIEMLKQSVERQPNIPAVFSPEGQFTYSQLWNCALRAAGRMKRLGITKGDTLTIELPRTPEYVSVMIAAWIRGAVFAALDVTYPKDRLDYIALNCNAKLRVNSSFLEELEDEAPIDSFEKLEPLDPSLLIYTSGSTGNPKGVLHSHLSIYNSTLRLMKAFSDIGISSGFRHASSAPFSFVAGIQGLFAVLCNGSTYYPVPYSVMRDHEKLADFIEENSIDCAYISPKMLRVFKPRSKKLRFATTGSERVTGIFRDDIRILNCYGSSESAGGVLFFPIDKAYDNTPVGRPTGNEHVYILDDNNNQVDEGELCLTGHFALGYLGLQENTAKTFVPNPFRQHDGFDVMLRSNDIVRRLPDGNIIYINRKDWMVKINGQRVEPGEIEAVLRSVPGVQDAAVKDFENTYQQIYLCAFYSIKPGVSVTEDELRSAAKAKLPAYMIPAFFVKLEKLPVNDNGKLNRKALKAPDAAAWQAEYIAPESEAQKLLCEGMAKVLGLERVGLDDDFFMIGGDSIKAVMLAEHCSVLHLSAAEIYEGRTPRSIAKTCEGRAADTVITKHENRFAGIYPLTASECGMYIEQLANPQSTEYNLNLFYTIRGAGREQIEKAVNDTMTNHEAFHSYYGEVEDLPVRILSDKLPTLTWKAAKDIDAARNNAIADEKPFDLRSGVPVRLTAYELPNNEMLLHIAIHHIAFDGGSSQILTDELLQRLNGITPEKLPDLSDIAGDDHNEEYKAGFEFYREMFKGGVPANEMPVKCTRPQVIPAADEITHLHFDNDMLSAIQRAAKYFRVTDFEFIFAAISMVVAQYCASDDVVLGIPSNMRNARSKNIIGMFVNTAPVRVMPVRTKTVREFLAEVSQIVRAATRTAWLPFSEIVKEFVPVNDTSRNPVFDVSVNYLLTEHEKKSGNVSISLNSELQKMKRDFVFTIYREDSTIDMLLAYSPELYEPALIGRFLQQLDSTIMAMTNFTDEIDIDTALKLPETQLAELEALSMSAKADI